MALKKCKECGNEVSSKAKKCPNCGIKNPTENKVLNFFIGIGIIVFIFYLFSGGGADINESADGFSTLSLNVRTGPTTEHEVVTSLKKGEQVEFVKDSLGWKLVKLVEREEQPQGWASSKYLSDISEYASFQSEQEDIANEPTPPTREERIESQFSAWDGSHRNLERYIKENMNDPDSYEHDETVYWDREDHLIVRTTFRGKNAFGGTVKNSVRAKVSLDGDVIEILSQ